MKLVVQYLWIICLLYLIYCSCLLVPSIAWLMKVNMWRKKTLFFLKQTKTFEKLKMIFLIENKKEDNKTDDKKKNTLYFHSFHFDHLNIHRHMKERKKKRKKLGYKHSERWINENLDVTISFIFVFLLFFLFFEGWILKLELKIQ